jgi:uncharacterized membrane protein
MTSMPQARQDGEPSEQGSPPSRQRPLARRLEWLRLRTRAHGGRAQERVTMRGAVTVGRPPQEVYRFWRDLRNLPSFIADLVSVEVLDERRSRWIAATPGGLNVAWDAELIGDRPDELIAWRAVGSAALIGSGSVRFVPAPGGRGTEVHLELQSRPPSAVGKVAARLFGPAIEARVISDLRRFKQVMETGEVVRSDASIHRGPHAAQPPAQRSRFEGCGRRPDRDRAPASGVASGRASGVEGGAR